MEFYSDLITQKSLQLLQDLRRRYNFILIGGWAVFMYTGALKSKDVDLVVDYQDLEKLKANFDLIKNDRLKKYEIKQEEIDIDVYLPHYSNLGLPVEEIKNYVIQQKGFLVPKMEVLLILKQFVYDQRQGSPKAEKDRLDILSLLKLREIDWSFYQQFLKKYKLEEFKNRLINLLKDTRQAPELGLNEYSMAKLRREVSSKVKPSE